MTAFEYIMPSEYGNHGVHENIDETFIKRIDVICFTRNVEA